jgi:hypothetical protein
MRNPRNITATQLEQIQTEHAAKIAHHLDGITNTPAVNSPRVYNGQYLSALFNLPNTVGVAPVIAVDWNNGNVQNVVLGHTGTATIALSNAVPGGRYTLMMEQPPGGGCVVDYAIAGVRYSDAITPTQTLTGSKIDILAFIRRATEYIGSDMENC